MQWTLIEQASVLMGSEQHVANMMGTSINPVGCFNEESQGGPREHSLRSTVPSKVRSSSTW